MIRGKEIMAQVDLEIGSLANNQNKLTVLFVVDRLEIMGGLETYLYHLCRELIKRGHKIILDCSYVSPIMKQLFSCAETLEAMTTEEIGRVIQKNNVDLIHCQPFESAERALVLHEQTKVPFVLTWHGAYYMDNFPAIAKKSEKIICVSEEVYDILLKKYPLAETKLVIIQNGIDINEFKPVACQGESKEITFIGRECLDRLAGLKFLIDSFSQSSFQKLNIVGFNKIKELEQYQQCNFVGEVADVREYINRADVVVATGRGIREALACGKACIVLSNWGYDGIVCPSTFKNLEYANFSGRGLAEPLSSERILHDLNVLMSTELRDKLGLYGRRLVEQFYDIEKIADKTEIVYWQAVEDSKLPKVSVLLPVYNHANFVGPCLMSLLNQTYQDFEIVIINDGSKDPLSQIISEFRDKRIRYIHREENKGLPKTLNEALRLSQGKYITWTSADNLHYENYLERLVEVLEREAECGSIYSDYLQIDQNTTIIKKVSKGIYTLNGETNYGPSFLYRFEAINRVGFFDENLFGIEDRDYSIRMAATAPVFWLPEVLYEYRIHQQSLTGKYVNKEIDFTPVIQAFSDKWKWLRQYPHSEAVSLERDEIVYGQRKILPVNMDCTVNSTMNKNLNFDPIFLGKFLFSVYRCFAQVDINHFLHDMLILRAELQFFCIRNDNKITQALTVHSVKEPWDEKELTWSNMPETESESIDEVLANNIYNWVSFDITGLVQSWADRSIANYGVCLRMKDEEQGEIVAGVNRHGINTMAHPRLVVEYTGKNRCLTC
ncbi:glycosyltransferase [Desulforamulus aeronauticus]|uniref:Glycosyltransferase involved in cell wall bisynthesis n=1 Tax=Desulforamulus aeronauticus DSM 10349 TaxID=1121421 RepID=A0A1M6VKB5_9FIRM|nr:glycosyltransferase [Desulforamulus aeronauticus]SHK81801.1 Glycosyltransferase involved in cell wall bisynthesis [Desulforamulus aeronauticus DSM 10349]